MMFCGVLSQKPLEILESRDNRFDLQCATLWVAQALLHCPQLLNLGLVEEQSLQGLSSDYWRAFGDVVSQCPQLESLDLQFNALYELVPEDWEALFQGLSRCQKLRVLNFRRAFIRSDDVCGLKVDNCIALCVGLSQCTQLKVLDFSGNQLGRSIDVWLALCRGLSQCKQLQTLSLCFNQLNNLLPHCWTALFQTLAQYEQFHTLNLTCALYDDRRFDLFDLEQFNLEPVDPASYRIWMEFCHGLSQCTQLQTLDLSDNQIGSRSQILDIDLPSNRIKQRLFKDWTALCEALSQCRQLRTLELSGNFHTDYDRYQEIFSKVIPEFCGDIQMIDYESGFLKAMVEENRRKTKDCMVGAVDVMRHILPVQELRPVVLSFLFPVWQKPLLQRIDHIMEAKEKRKAGLSIV
jgi:Ran GTPase-activating protein (RanGAP) involved in mRNA processing and transport